MIRRLPRVDAGPLVRHARRRFAGRGGALPAVLPTASRFHNAIVILLAFGMVFVTLVGQGLTLPMLIRATTRDRHRRRDRVELARDAMRRAAIQAVNKLVAEHGQAQKPLR